MKYTIWFRIKKKYFQIIYLKNLFTFESLEEKLTEHVEILR